MSLKTLRGMSPSRKPQTWGTGPRRGAGDRSHPAAGGRVLLQRRLINRSVHSCTFSILNFSIIFRRRTRCHAQRATYPLHPVCHSLANSAHLHLVRRPPLASSVLGALAAAAGNEPLIEAFAPVAVIKQSGEHGPWYNWSRSKETCRAGNMELLAAGAHALDNSFR
jgi:hypothetical protein